MWRNRLALRTVLREELRPYEGRLGQTVRMTVLCMVIVAVAMALQVPEAAISCYLVFFAARDNAGSAIRIGIALIVAATAGILLAFVLLMVSADEPELRLLLIVLFTFAGMFFSQASKAGPIAATVGFVFAFALTLYDEVPTPELLTRGLAWIWVAVFFPMLFMIVLNALAGTNPATLLRRELAQRLAAAAEVIRSPDVASKPVSQLLAHGNEPLHGWRKSARFLARMSPEELARTERLIVVSFDLLAYAEAAWEIDVVWSDDERDDLLDRLARLQGAIVAGKALPAREDDAHPPFQALGKREVARSVARLEQILASPPTPASADGDAEAQEPFLAKDAFTNPVYTQFALKSLLAVMICYITYTALGWFEIHTAMVTGYYVALGTTGETIHKLTLRITGALIGAAMGIGAVLFLMPHMTDIGHLLALVGVGTFVSAWVANGSKRIQYVGWQMALCFFLTVLVGYGPNYDLQVAGSRVIGILFGNVVITLIFTYLWPVSIASAVGKHLSAALATLSKMLDTSRPKPSELQSFYPLVEAAERSHELHIFEMQRDQGEIARNARLHKEIAELAFPVLLLAEAPHESPLMERHIPGNIQRAFALFRISAAAFLRDCSVTAVNGNPQHTAVNWSRPYTRLRSIVTREWQANAHTLGKSRASILAELQARLLLCQQIDTQMSRIAAQWS